MPKATRVHSTPPTNAPISGATSRRNFLTAAGIAAGGTALAVVAGAAPMAAAPADRPAGTKAERDPRAAIDQFANELLKVNIAAINENDQYVVYSVRVPREALGPDLYRLGGLDDDKFGADLAAWIAARFQQI
jgi:hypothetical protein